MEDNYVLNQDGLNKAFKVLEKNGYIGKSKRLPEDGDYIFGEEAEKIRKELGG